MSRIGDRLRETIPEGRGEQKALAYRAGMDPATLNKILTGATKDPGFETIAAIARVSGLDMNRLAAEAFDPPEISSLAADLLSLADRRRLAEFAAWLVKRFGIAAMAGPDEDNILEFVPYTPPRREVIEETFTFPISPDEFRQKDFDYPQPWHYWATDEPIEDLPAAAAGPRGASNAHLLNPRGRNVREVIDRVNQVIRVEGESMEDRYFHGDLVRVDTENRRPTKGDPIAVYCDDLGGSLLGFYRKDRERVVLVKKNKPAYQDVVLPPSGWVLLGTIVEIVSRRERKERL